MLGELPVQDMLPGGLVERVFPTCYFVLHNILLKSFRANDISFGPQRTPPNLIDTNLATVKILNIRSLDPFQTPTMPTKIRVKDLDSLD